MTYRLLLLALLLCPLLSSAQLEISHPMPRLVVQRGSDGNGRLYVSGRFAGTAERIEAQLTPVQPGQGTATGWQLIQENPMHNQFLGYLTAAGGWYVLSVRQLSGGNVIAETATQPVGIGEVFVTAGQSNARGLGNTDNDLGSVDDRVNGIDSINHYYPPGSSALYASGDPMPVPTYRQLSAGKKIFPMAESTWGWGELGDYIVHRYNVPVAFYVTAWDVTTVDNWYSTANGIPACNRYWCAENWANLQPYTNLKNVLHYYLSVTGARAALWHQGEAEYDFPDNTSIPPYADKLINVIQHSRQDYGNRNLPWVVARVSFDGSTTRQGVIDKQMQVINTPGFNVFMGPYNDTIQNRHAGNVDVHFANSQRISPSPQYYVGTTPIPPDMGLSRYARNWNQSLDNAFFQNAQPITPVQFAATGNIPPYVMPNGTIQVSYMTNGQFDVGNGWQVQLLDEAGHFLAVLGSSDVDNPIAVTMPSAYSSGRYRIRVVSSSPALPAVPSNVFEVSPLAGQADLSLAMQTDKRVIDVGEPFIVRMSVKNTGPAVSNSVVVQDRLPPNVAFVSGSGVTESNGVLSGTIPSLDVNETATLFFVAQTTTPGVFINAAEIISASTTDPDSQANSGTADGQDDAAQVDIRTRQPDATIYTSPNPNQLPLPPVESNQPVPDQNKADLSLGLVASQRALAVGDTVTYTLRVANAGGQNATGVTVAAYLPAGQAFLSGVGMSASGTGATGTIATINANNQAVLSFRAVVTAAGYGVCKAEITAAAQPDPDSTPGNGTENGEDDTAWADTRTL